MGFYQCIDSYKAYLEIIPYNKLIQDSQKRNKILFDKLFNQIQVKQFVSKILRYKVVFGANLALIFNKDIVRNAEGRCGSMKNMQRENFYQQIIELFENAKKIYQQQLM